MFLFAVCGVITGLTDKWQIYFYNQIYQYVYLMEGKFLTIAAISLLPVH